MVSIGGMWHHIEPPQWPLPWPGGKRSSSLECHTHFGSKYVNLNALMETHYPSVNSWVTSDPTSIIMASIKVKCLLFSKGGPPLASRTKKLHPPPFKFTVGILPELMQETESICPTRATQCWTNVTHVDNFLGDDIFVPAVLGELKNVPFCWILGECVPCLLQHLAVWLVQWLCYVTPSKTLEFMVWLSFQLFTTAVLDWHGVSWVKSGSVPYSRLKAVATSFKVNY